MGTQEPRITPDEAEQIRSGYLPPSAIPKVSDAVRAYHGVVAVPTGTERPCGCPWNVCPHGGPMWTPGYEAADNCEGQAAYEESTEPGAFPVMGDPWAPGHDSR